MNKNLEYLTSETIKEIQNLEIVLPEIYKDVFYTKAETNKIKIDIDDKEEALMYALKKIKKIEKNTQESATELKQSVISAQKAIVEKDTSQLKTIEENMLNLEKKILKLQGELFRDELTDVYNRRWLFNHYLEDEKFIKKGVLVFIDIDDFKAINDNYGHIVGDKVLKLIAQTLKRVDDSKIVRYAGDEFLLITTKKNIEDIKTLLLTILKNLSTTGLKSGDDVFTVSFSYGVCTFKKGSHIKNALDEADQNMYSYKNSK